MAESCETPLVIDLYGTWGIGKTSMMRQIQGELDENELRTVWFDHGNTSSARRCRTA
jgi:ABC-type transport system involved in cytochrome c biogenesis ATPase subunit